VFENPKLGFRSAAHVISDEYIDGVCAYNKVHEINVWMRFVENPDGKFESFLF